MKLIDDDNETTEIPTSSTVLVLGADGSIGAIIPQGEGHEKAPDNVILMAGIVAMLRTEAGQRQIRTALDEATRSVNAAADRTH